MPKRPRKTAIICDCGGTVYIEDCGDRFNDPEYRFESYCDDCKACDPNGHRTVAKCHEAAKEFFPAPPSATLYR